MTFNVTKEQLACIRRVINKGRDKDFMTAEQWLTDNLNSLILQCVNIERQDKIRQLGELTDTEIALIKNSRT